MNTSIEIDKMLFDENNLDFCAIKENINSSALDNCTKDYYYVMLNIKKALNSLKNEEKFLFDLYFINGAKLSDWKKLLQFNKEDNLILPKTSLDFTKILAKACVRFLFAFCIFPDVTNEKTDKIINALKLCHDFELKGEFSKHYDLYKSFLTFDTYNKNINVILKSKKKSAIYFKYIYHNITIFQDILHRIVLSNPDEFFEKLEKESLLF